MRESHWPVALAEVSAPIGSGEEIPDSLVKEFTPGGFNRQKDTIRRGMGVLGKVAERQVHHRIKTGCMGGEGGGGRGECTDQLSRRKPNQIVQKAAQIMI